MNNESAYAWIKNATYEQLLRKNRFASIGDSMFIGELGTFFMKTMKVKKQDLTNEEQVKISKKIGWEA